MGHLCIPKRDLGVRLCWAGNFVLVKLNDIAGYTAAVERETFQRNAAFVPVREKVCGILLDPLTVGHIATLQSIGSPFVNGGRPTPLHALQFLCLLSPESGKPGTFKRWRFLCRCHKLKFIVMTEPPTFPVLDAISEFVTDAFADAPGNRETMARSYYSLAAASVGLIARNYHWPEREILDLPLKRFWQYRAEIMASSGETVLFNGSDRVIQKWLDRRN